MRTKTPLAAHRALEAFAKALRAAEARRRGFYDKYGEVANYAHAYHAGDRTSRGDTAQVSGGSTSSSTEAAALGEPALFRAACDRSFRRFRQATQMVVEATKLLEAADNELHALLSRGGDTLVDEGSSLPGRGRLPKHEWEAQVARQEARLMAGKGYGES